MMVMSYDLNYLSKYITPNTLGGHMTSVLNSETLITLIMDIASNSLGGL